MASVVRVGVVAFVAGAAASFFNASAAENSLPKLPSVKIADVPQSRGNAARRGENAGSPQR